MQTRIAREEAGGVLSVDLSAIAANWQVLRSRASKARCSAVVKADGYGLRTLVIEALASEIFRSR